MSWETVIGLEVHVQLATRSKMFCACSTNFGDPPNTNTCPVCLGLPGALPVPNREAVKLAVRAAAALKCTVHETSVFARKNYFYPDLPKGYQISQFERPLATSGSLEIANGAERREVGIARLHIEEDAGKLLHDRFSGLTAIDLNRCGVPLVEIVTEPDLRSPQESRHFLGTLKQILEYLEVSDCNMEEGSLRVDANLSVKRAGEPLGVKQEVKNLNSFAAVERALGALRDMQIASLERGTPVQLTTYSAATGELSPMREKEESEDYRYFPEPDLPPLSLTSYGIDVGQEAELLPELPEERKRRFVQRHGLSQYDAGVLTATRRLADYYEATVACGEDPKTVANWVMGPVLADAKQRGGRLPVAPARLAGVIGLVREGKLSNQAGKKVLAALAGRDGEPLEVADSLGILQVEATDQLIEWANAVLAAHPAEVKRYRDGETRLLGFFMGQIMRASGGRADPKRAREILANLLG